MKYFTLSILIILFILSGVEGCSDNSTNPSGNNNQTSTDSLIFSFPDSIYLEWSGGFYDTIYAYPQNNWGFGIWDSLHINYISNIRFSFNVESNCDTNHSSINLRFRRIDTSNTIIDTTLNTSNLLGEHTFNSHFPICSGYFYYRIIPSYQNTGFRYPHYFIKIKNFKFYKVS